MTFPLTKSISQTFKHYQPTHNTIMTKSTLVQATSQLSMLPRQYRLSSLNANARLPGRLLSAADRRCKIADIISAAIDIIDEEDF